MFEKADRQEIARLGYVYKQDTGFVSGNWDHADLYDAATYGTGKTDKPVGLVSRNSKGSWTVSLTARAYVDGGNVSRNGVEIPNRPRAIVRSVVVSRASVAESIAEAHRQREALEAESQEVWDTWRRAEQQRHADSLALQRAEAKRPR